jgi:hypothetical protein
LWEVIRQAGFDPSGFRWMGSEETDVAVENTEVLLYGEEAYFAIDVSEESTECRYAPGIERLHEERTTYEWARTLDLFDQWLRVIQREERSPDLWATLGQESSLLTDVRSGDDNSPFSVGEQKRIADDIEQIKRHLAAMSSFTALQLEGINSRLDEMQESSTRLGRKDWKNYALGVVTSIILTYGLTGDTAKEVFRITGELLKWIFHTTPLLS